MKVEEVFHKLSYEMVQDLAPDEIDLYEDFKEAFLKNPDFINEEKDIEKDQMLGFAVSQSAEEFFTALILPFIMKITRKYINKLTKEKWDPEEINKLRDEAYDLAIILEMDEKKANLLADSLIGKMTRMNMI